MQRPSNDIIQFQGRDTPPIQKPKFPNLNSLYAVLPPPPDKQPTFRTSPFQAVINCITKSNETNAATIGHKLSKILKTEKKLDLQRRELEQEFSTWANGISNDDNLKLLSDFIDYLRNDITLRDQSIQKEEIIRAKLLDVYKREKKCEELRATRDRALLKMKEEETKGTSQNLTFLKEKYEELECTLDIVDDQFIRSINHEFGVTLGDYMNQVQFNASQYMGYAQNFIQNNLDSIDQQAFSPSQQEKAETETVSNHSKILNNRKLIANNNHHSRISLSDTQVSRKYNWRNKGLHTPAGEENLAGMMLKNLDPTPTQSEESDYIEGQLGRRQNSFGLSQDWT